MILIADSGSTKCTWALCKRNGEISSFHQTTGFNPKFNNFNSILKDMENSSLSGIRNLIEEVYFYGAGCSSSAKNIIISEPLQVFFKSAKIEIRHDLEAALKATYRKNPIICCILGTGSNSCIFDGKDVFENAPSLGYIAGDEGSGNFFGKKIVNLYINNVLSKDINKRFENWHGETKEEIIENIYSVQRPNLYLANFFRFMYENKQEEMFDNIFRNGIQTFFNLHIKCFTNYHDYPLTFVGSVAFYLSEYLHEIAENEGMKIQQILQSPIKNLVKCHFKK